MLLTGSGTAHGENDVVRAGREAMERLLRLNPRPSAIIFPSDMFALGGLLKAAEEGLDIPRELSMLSMFEYSMGSWFKPALTTMRVPEEAIAKATIAFFCDILEKGGSASWRRNLPAELIIRDSCAPPSR